MVGIRRGWGGLLETNPDRRGLDCANVLSLSPAAVRTIDRTGGTILHTSRTNPARVRVADVPGFLSDRVVGDGPFDFTAHTIRVIEKLGLEALIPIGGDDTLSYGLRLHDEGVPGIAIPKTMDNDVHGTDYCIGFSTHGPPAVSSSYTHCAPRPVHTSASRWSSCSDATAGETSLVTGDLAGADRAVISEVPFDAGNG